jgi:predicted Fe-Mo cluster-binding NifX family protein
MKIAIPTRGSVVDDHFGHCEKYTIFTLNENNQIIGNEILPSPQGCGCKSNIAAELQEKGITIMLAGNMGDGALTKLQTHGIEVYRGCAGDVNNLIADFAQGKIADSGEKCHHHGDGDNGHVCNH